MSKFFSKGMMARRRPPVYSSTRASSVIVLPVRLTTGVCVTRYPLSLNVQREFTVVWPLQTKHCELQRHDAHGISVDPRVGLGEDGRAAKDAEDKCRYEFACQKFLTHVFLA